MTQKKSLREAVLELADAFLESSEQEDFSARYRDGMRAASRDIQALVELYPGNEPDVPLINLPERKDVTADEMVRIANLLGFDGKQVRRIEMLPSTLIVNHEDKMGRMVETHWRVTGRGIRGAGRSYQGLGEDLGQ